jgi:glycosyltransferase involved in cell wall biosynthesis
MNSLIKKSEACRITAIVLTYNEKEYIRECLESIKWCDDIWIVDSGSTDGTVDICKEYTKNIIVRPFKNFAEQKNWAIINLPIHTEWIIFVDSDERVSPELREEIIRTLAERPAVDGFHIPFKQFFWGKCLIHGGAWPNYVLRLFRKGKGYYLDHEVHEPLILIGKAGFLKNPIIHIARSSLHEAIAKLNLYTSFEAIRMYRKKEGLYPVLPSDSNLKKTLKKIFDRVPFKPLAKFLWDFIILQGFRDGYIGFVWAALQSFYVFSAYFKLWELKEGITTVEQLQSYVENYTKKEEMFFLEKQ